MSPNANLNAKEQKDIIKIYQKMTSKKDTIISLDKMMLEDILHTYIKLKKKE